MEKNWEDWRVEWSATLILHLDLVSSTVVLPLLPVYDISVAEAGFVLLAKPAVEMVCNVLLIGSTFADYFPAKLPATAGMIVTAIGLVVFAFLSSFWALVAARAFTGLGASFAVPAAMKLIGMHFEDRPARREGAIALALSGDAAGGIVGPVLGSAGYFAGMALFGTSFWACAVPLLACALLSLVSAALVASVPSKKTQDTPRTRVPGACEILRSRGMPVVVVAAFTFAATALHIGTLEVVLPWFMTAKFKCGASCNGFFWAIVGIGFVAAAQLWSQLVLPWLAQGGTPFRGSRSSITATPASPDVDFEEEFEFGRQRTFEFGRQLTSRLQMEYPMHSWKAIAGGAVMLVIYPVLAWLENIWLMGLSMFLLGCSLGLIYVPVNASAQAATLSTLGQEALSRVMGLLQGAKNAAFIVGCILGPAVMTWSGGYGFLWLLLSIGGCVVFAAAFALRATMMTLLSGEAQPLVG